MTQTTEPELTATAHKRAADKMQRITVADDEVIRNAVRLTGRKRQAIVNDALAAGIGLVLLHAQDRGPPGRSAAPPTAEAVRRVLAGAGRAYVTRGEFAALVHTTADGLALEPVLLVEGAGSWAAPEWTVRRTTPAGDWLDVKVSRDRLLHVVWCPDPAAGGLVGRPPWMSGTNWRPRPSTNATAPALPDADARRRRSAAVSQHLRRHL